MQEHIKLHYRAVEGTNTKTRRLAYLTAILLALREGELSEPLLLNRVTVWSQDHRADLSSYYVSTGEITHTKKNSAATHYLDFAVKLKLIVSLSGMYHIARIGSVQAALIRTYKQNSNPFLLNSAEKIFYTYCLLKADADMVLTLVDSLMQQEGSLAFLQQTFQEILLERLNTKLLAVQDEVVRMQLRDRRMKVKEWKHMERYVEHIVPPRLNWLLDLGFLESSAFRQHHFQFTEAGRLFSSSLPYLAGPFIHDISDQWLGLEYWQVIAKTLLAIESLMQWTEVDKEAQYSIMVALLTEAFKVFRYSLVPRISLIQIMLYLSIRLLLDHRIVASPTVLTEWFMIARIMDGRRYEVRLSPRENESYLIIL